MKKFLLATSLALTASIYPTTGHATCEVSGTIASYQAALGGNLRLYMRKNSLSNDVWFIDVPNAAAVDREVVLHALQGQKLVALTGDAASCPVAPGGCILSVGINFCDMGDYTFIALLSP